jgi:cytosolic carboxypeptidase protein 5
MDLLRMEAQHGVKEIPTFNRQKQRWSNWNKPQNLQENDIFFYRQLLTRSLDGRRIELITISDWSDLLTQDQDGDCIRDQDKPSQSQSQKKLNSSSHRGGGGICETHHHMSEMHSVVFPEVNSFIRPHPPRFMNKKVVFLTARVHPGETPASHCLNGSLGFLLHPTDLRAVNLRKHFVFKIVSGALMGCSFHTCSRSL